MSKKQLIALLGVAVMLVGLFLPFAELFIASISLWDGDDGKIVLGAIILAAIAIVLRWNVFAIIVSLVGAAVSILDMVDSLDKGWDLGAGGYVIIAGAVIVVIGALAAMRDKRKASKPTGEGS